MISLETPKVMGIINCTPDSFFDGGKYNATDQALTQIEKHLAEGATFIDVGGYSSRPGADDVSVEEEISRVCPVIEKAATSFPNVIISIDTFRSKVASAALEAGASIINDISGGQLDDQMFDTVIDAGVPYIMMHMKKTPQDMQVDIHYDNLLTELGSYFSERVNYLNSQGVNDLVIDVGFGFAKTQDHNYELLANLQHFDFLKLPMLVGVSRKSMLYKPLHVESKDALNATTAANMIALQNGANILRVHDVKEAVECIKIYQLANAYEH